MNAKDWRRLQKEQQRRAHHWATVIRPLIDKWMIDSTTAAYRALDQTADEEMQKNGY